MMSQHKFDFVANQNKFGSFSHKFNLDTIKHHKTNHETAHKIHNALKNVSEQTEHSLKLKKILNDIVDKYAEPSQSIIANKEDVILDFASIYSRKAEEKITPTEIKAIKAEPRMKTVVQLAMSKARMDALIKKKQW
jgi:hypothetical protein